MDCSSSFWKFDKVDLSFLVFLLIITLACVTFASQTEEVDISIIDGLGMSSSANYFVNSPSNSVGYIQLEKGYIYHITSNVEARRLIGFSNSSPSANTPYYEKSTIGGYETIDYLVTSDFAYMFFSYNAVSSNVGDVISVSREYLPDMYGVVSNLSNDVGVNQFWSIFEFAIPFVAVVVLVVLGFFFVSKLMKKSSKGDIKF